MSRDDLKILLKPLDRLAKEGMNLDIVVKDKHTVVKIIPFLWEEIHRIGEIR